MRVRGAALAMTLAALSAVPPSAALATAPPASTVEVIVGLDRHEDGTAAVANAVAAAHGGLVAHVYRFVLDGFALSLPEERLAELRRDPHVSWVSPTTTLSATAAPAPCTDLTVCQRLSFGVQRIAGDVSSTRSGDGRGTVPGNVAVVDSGIDPDHPDLNVVGGVNCNGPGTSWADQNGHGSMVGGFIGALDNGFGRVGVAPGVRLWAVRVLSKNNSGTTADVICGIDWITSTRFDADPSNDITVANMSLGGPRRDADDGNCGLTDGNRLHQAICQSISAGVTYVAGAGNSASDLKDFEPAAYDDVLTAAGMADSDGQPGGVSTNPACNDFATETDDVVASFSNFATLPGDRAHVVTAPAVCVGSTWYDGTYRIWSGTSFASPLVAGTVALCLAGRTCRGLGPRAIVQTIIDDAASYSARSPGYGFVGDPAHPLAGHYYGNLVRAGDF